MTDTLDFFVIGVQKGGTTALDKMLREHPQIQLPDNRKELHFFDDEKLDWPEPDYCQLHEHFRSPKADGIRGEATPIYIFWPNALDRIKRYNPNAKLILLLREPGCRAFSHWRMETTRNRETLDFRSAIDNVGRERIGFDEKALRTYTYVERGHYAEQVERLLRLFPRSQLMFLRTDHFWLDQRATLERVCSFLGVDPDLLPKDSSQRRYIVPVLGSPQTQMPRCCRRWLDMTFANEVIKTAELTQLDLSDWLLEDYVEPMVAT